MKNDFEIRGDVTAVFVKNKGQTLEALISTARLPRVMEFPNKWYAAWCPSRKGYYVTGHVPKNNKKRYLLHRWILNVEDPDKEVDHFDNNPLNNLDCNLRVVTRAENLQNRTIQANNRSGYRCVSFHKKLGKWQANLRIGGKQAYLGIYESKEEAAAVVAEARRKHMPFSKEAAEVNI